jgi:hypothetical protein
MRAILKAHRTRGEPAPRRACSSEGALGYPSSREGTKCRPNNSVHFSPPPFDLPYRDEVAARLPVIVGGLSVAVARTCAIIDPQFRHPATEQWERAFEIFDLLLWNFGGICAGADPRKTRLPILLPSARVSLAFCERVGFHQPPPLLRPASQRAHECESASKSSSSKRRALPQLLLNGAGYL